jgi:DNA-binding PadR family transcriptional regulator
MSPYTFLARLTDDGLIDMFIVGPDGIPVARIKEPTRSGEEALAMAREYVNFLEAQQEEIEQEEEPEDVEQAPDF